MPQRANLKILQDCEKAVDEKSSKAIMASCIISVRDLDLEKRRKKAPMTSLGAGSKWKTVANGPNYLGQPKLAWALLHFQNERPKRLV